MRVLEPTTIGLVAITLAPLAGSSGPWLRPTYEAKTSSVHVAATGGTVFGSIRIAPTTPPARHHDSSTFTREDMAVLDRLAQIPVEDYVHVSVRDPDDD